MKCRTCGYDKDPSNFRPLPRTGKPQHPCKACLSGRTRACQLRDPSRTKANAYRSRFGIDFEALWEAQGGKCAVCGGPLVRGGKQPDSVTVDHDRSCCSGLKSCGKCVRGFIHRKCNLVLGYAKDDPQVLLGLADYLDHWNSRGAS